MKYSTIVIAALFGYTNAVTIKDDDVAAALQDNAPEARNIRRASPAKKFDSSDSDSSDDDFFAPNKPQQKSSKKFGKGGMGGFGGDNGLDIEANGKGVIFEGEAGANSFQGQAVKVLPDTRTTTQGSSSTWAKNNSAEDGNSQQSISKNFDIHGKITVKEDTVGNAWEKSAGESDGSAQKKGEQVTKVLDSDYEGMTGSLKSCSAEQDAIKNFH